MVPLPVSRIFPVPNAIDLVVDPVGANMPVDKVQLPLLPVKSIVPAVKVVVLVEPMVQSSCSWKVPPAPLNVTGKSRVLPLAVMVLVPDVAVKVTVLVPVPTVMPELTVRPPAIDSAVLVQVPENPEKLSDFTPNDVVKDTVSVPAVTLKSMLVLVSGKLDMVLVPVLPL